jgi:homoserine kinase type II
MKRLAAYHWSHVEKAQDSIFVLLDMTSLPEKDTQIQGVFSNQMHAEQARDRLNKNTDNTVMIKEYTLDQLV